MIGNNYIIILVFLDSTADASVSIADLAATR